MSKPRQYIPLAERLAAALADLLPQAERDALRARKVPASVVLRLFTPDHNILHAFGGSDSWWNLTMRRRGPELASKDKADAKVAAKDKRLRGVTGNGPRQQIPRRAFPKSNRQIRSRGFQ